MNEPYSVLMSVYINENPEYFKSAVESVMKQTILPSDFVLVCDGPLTEELDAVIEELSKIYNVFNVIRLEQNVGLGSALAIGILETKYDIVMRMDSDDLCLPNRAELQLPLMDQFDLVGGYITEFEGDPNNIIGTRKPPLSYEEIYAFAKRRTPFNHPSVMYRKSIVLQAGNYQVMPYFEDYYLWVRFLQVSKRVCNLDQVLVHMRSGVEMRARRGNKEARKSVRAVRKYMYQIKMIDWPSYVFFTFAQNAILSLPLGLRSWVYKKLLRK